MDKVKAMYDKTIKDEQEIYYVDLAIFVFLIAIAVFTWNSFWVLIAFAHSIASALHGIRRAILKYQKMKIAMIDES